METLKTEKKTVRDTKLSKDRWELVESHMDLIDSVLSALSNRFTAVYQDSDEFRDVVTWGLIHAARKFDFDNKSAKFSTYAIKIMNNDAMKKMNSIIKRNERFVSKGEIQFFIDSEDNVDMFSAEGSCQLDQIVEKENLMKLYNAIISAPEKTKEVIKMRFFEKKSYKEIAEKMGVSSEMARIYTNNALKYLNERL